MKHITKKIIALLASAVTAVTTLSASYSAVFAETEQETAASSADSDYEIKSGGLLGSLMPDEFQSLAEENEEAKSSDYAVYKLEYDKDNENLIISYSAKEECTIFVGFYNDEGTQLYTSLTETVPEGTNKMMAVKKPDGLPDYYLIKAFMVGKFNNPVSKPCTYEKCTKAIQEVLAKKIDEFDEDKIIRFDEKDDFNFMVTKNKCVKVYSTDTKDTLIENDDPDTYVFEKIDAIKDVKEGQDVLVYTPDDMAIFRVGSITIDGTTATIKKQFAEMDELVEFLRFDSSNYMGDVKSSYTPNDNEYIEKCEILSNQTSPTGVNENGISRKPDAGDLKAIQLPNVTLSDSFRFDLKCGLKSNATLGSYIKIGVKLNMEVYFTPLVNVMKGDVTFDFEIGINAAFSDKIQFGELSIGWLPASISVIPTIRIKLTGKLSYNISKTYDFVCIPYCDTIVTPRDFELPDNTWDYGIDAEVSIGLNCGINVVSKHIARLSVEPCIVLALGIHNSKDIDNEYTRHDCDSCLSITLTVSAKVKGEFKFLDFIDSYENDYYDYYSDDDDIDNIDYPKGFMKHFEYNNSDLRELKIDLYKKESHIKNGNAYDGPCDNLSHKIILHVKEATTDDKGKEITKPVSGASIYSGKYISDSEKFVDDNKNDILTDENGNAALWVKDKLLTDEEYCITVKSPDNKAALVRVGKNWDPTLNKANEYDVVIDINSESVDPDEGISYPITGNCGVGRTQILGDIEYDRVTYSYWSNGECDVWGYGTLDGYKLTSDLLKKGFKTIKKLQIGNGVEVNPSAKLGFNIEEVEFIGNNGKVLPTTFNESNNLKKVTLSDFEELDYNAFVGCENLKEIEGTYYLKKIGPYAFSGCSKLTKFDFSYNLKEIKYCAFRYTGLQKIIMSPKLKTIEERAFYGCSDLTSVTLNEGLEKIGDDAFGGIGIKSINIPASVNSMYWSFRSCPKLKTVIINGDITNESGCQPFWDSPVETLIMNDGVTNINDLFFCGQEEIKNVRFSKNLKSIGASAFQVTALTNINLPDSLETIGKDAFYSTRLTSVTIPKSVTEIGASAFDCDTLKEIVIFNYNCDLKEKVVPKSTIIWGYTGSSAEAYAKKYGNPFKALDAPVVTTTAVKTTTAKTTTTTTAVVTTKVAPDSECVFIAVNDDKTVNGSADELLDRENVRFFDQQTANGDGVVSFSYLPDENEKWAFIFVSEAINDTITKTFGTPDALKITTYNVAPGVKGDANGDGEIDMSDVVLIMQALANPNKYGIEGTDPKHITVSGFGYADSDGDGLTVNDALRIQKYLLGLIPSLS